MAKSHISNDGRTPDPAGVEAGAQSGTGGVGGAPKGSTLEAQRRESSQAPHAQTHAREPREHSSDTAQPGYRARPAGKSGVGLQEDDTSALDGPQGEGNYLASDRGDQPLRNG